MAWLLEVSKNGEDLYPVIKKMAAEKNARSLAGTIEKHGDMVRFEMMKHFGYYITESSEHNAEYSPYWIKSRYPQLIEDYNIPLDEYPRRCIEQIENWEKQRESITSDHSLSHEMSHEYGSNIINALVTDDVFRFHGNVLNRGAIPNLPDDAVVEIPCLVDRNGVQGVFSGALPPQCAALNLSHINVHTMTVEAALSGSRDALYQAAFLDPHTSGELSLADIRSLCDELLEAHGESCSIID